MKQLTIIKKYYDVNINGWKMMVNSEQTMLLKMIKLVQRFKQSTFFINLFSITGATILSRLIGLFVIGYPARVLGAENFGLLAFGSSVMAYASILLSPGLVTWGIRTIAQNKDKTAETIIIINLTQFGLACLSYSGLVTYAFISLQGSERSIVLLYGLSLFMTALAVDWVFYGLEKMRIIASMNVLASVLNVCCLLLFVHFPKDVFWVPIIGVIIQIIISGMLYILLFQKYIITKIYIPKFQKFESTLVSSIPLGIMTTLVVMLKYANIFILKHYINNVALGIFFAAFSLTTLISTLPIAINSVLLPRLSSIYMIDKEKAQRQARSYAIIQMTIGFFAASVLFAESNNIINIIYGATYLQASNILRLLCLGVVFNFAIIGYTNSLIAFKKDTTMVFVTLVSIIVAIGGGLLLIPRFGIIGAGIAVACIDLFGWIVSIPVYQRTIGALQLTKWGGMVIASGGILYISSELQVMGVNIVMRLFLYLLVYSPFALYILKRSLA